MADQLAQARRKLEDVLDRDRQHPSIVKIAGITPEQAQALLDELKRPEALELEVALRECHQQMEQAVVLCDRGRPTMAAAILRACLRGSAGPVLLARSAEKEGSERG